MSKPISFEAVKLHLKQDKNGNVLTLAIHPADTPDEIWKTKAGTRYGVALVLLDEEAAAHEDTETGERVFRMVQAKCQEPVFQRWMKTQVHAQVGAPWSEAPSEEVRTREMLKYKLGIASTKEIRDNPQVREQFLRLIDVYNQATRSEAL